MRPGFIPAPQTPKKLPGLMRMIWGLLFSLNQRSNFKNACGTSTLMGAIVPPLALAHHVDAILQVKHAEL